MTELDWPRDGRHIFAGGSWVELDGAGVIPAISPIDEEVIGQVAAARAVDVARAVELILPACKPWAALGADGRLPYLRAFSEAILANANYLAELEVIDGGLTAGNAASDMKLAADIITFYNSYAPMVNGQTYPTADGTFAYTEREPYGIAAALAPFNHPIFLSISQVAAALLAGNVVIVKPPEQASLSSLALAEIARGVFPPGVYNVITGYGHEAGAAIVAHPAIPRIAFTGSVPTGRRILEGAAPRIKHISLELGGKNPLIITATADPEFAINLAVRGMNFQAAGQSCASTSRLLIHEDLYDQVVAGVGDKMDALVVGDPRDKTTGVAPLCFKEHYDRVLGYIATGLGEGAKLIVGGGRPAQFERGYYLEPTLFGEVTEEMTIANEEIFGPVLVAMRFEDTDEAIRIANSVEYGLAAKVAAGTLDEGLEIGRQLQAGTVVVNSAGMRPWGMPFGGYKQSGLGRQTCLDEVLSFTQEKSMVVGI
jgi:betaine-aldehyde dehydrogenase